MSRQNAFHEGHAPVAGQMDLLTQPFEQHLRAHAGVNAAPQQVALGSDKHNNLLYLAKSRDVDAAGRDLSDGTVRAYYATEDSATQPYREVGQLSWHRDLDRGAQAPAEVDQVVTHEARDRRRGVASALWNYGRQFADIRHSMTRTNDGQRWAAAVGGADVHGRDTRDYDFAQQPDAITLHALR